MKNKLILIIAIFILLVLTTCTKTVVGPDACFQEEVLPIFVSNCTMSNCHNAVSKKAGYDLTSYEGIMQGITSKHPLRSEIYNSIKGNKPSMPQEPYSKLNTKDVNTIKLWINMGAKNTSNCKSCDSITFTYTGRIKNTMQVWCIGCHNSGISGGGFDLSNYNGVIAAIPSGKLLGSLKHLQGFSAMPQNGGQVSQCDINAIQKWISSGYPNN